MKPPMFIGGAGRSGTTLLRVMLDSHPDICSPVEFKMLPDICTAYKKHRGVYYGSMQAWGFDRETIKAPYRDLILSLFSKVSDKRIAEKTPDNVYHFWLLHELFPDSPLIQVIRDGRDVCASLFELKAKNPMTGKIMDYGLYPKSAADYWKYSINCGKWGIENIGESYAKRYYEVRYEDLINDTEVTLRNLFDFIGEPWQDEVLEYYKIDRNFRGEASANQASKDIYKTSIGRYKTDLPQKDRQEFELHAGQLLKQLNYGDLIWQTQ